jgi:hypothetical protein
MAMYYENTINVLTLKRLDPQQHKSFGATDYQKCFLAKCFWENEINKNKKAYKHISCPMALSCKMQFPSL